MLLLYAVIPADRPAGSLVSAGLTTITAGPLGVVVEQRDDRPGTSRDEVVRFGKLVRRIGEDGPALPIRYGSVAASCDEVLALIDENAERWQERLVQVAGHVEIVLTIHERDGDADPAAAAGSGRQYLLDRAEAVHRRESLGRAALAAARPWCRDVRRLDRPGQGSSVRLACLVHPERVDPLEDAFAELASSSDRRVTMSGPWPPFSFAEEGADRDGAA